MCILETVRCGVDIDVTPHSLKRRIVGFPGPRRQPTCTLFHVHHMNVRSTLVHVTLWYVERDAYFTPFMLIDLTSYLAPLDHCKSPKTFALLCL